MSVPELQKVYKLREKERQSKIEDLKIKFFDDFNSNDDLEINEFNSKLKKIEKEVVRNSILNEVKELMVGI